MVVVSYNIDCARSPSVNHTLTRLLSMTDILCLQESKISELHGESFLDIESGLGIYLSPDYTFIDTVTVELPALVNSSWLERLIESTIELGWNQRYYTDVPRKAVIASVRHVSTGSSFCVVNTHLDWRARAFQRFLQLSYLSGYLSSLSTAGKKVILCGDLNTVGFGRSSQQRLWLKQLLRGFNGVPSVFTRTTTHYQHLDYMLTQGVTVTRREVLSGATGSDHYPLLLEIV